ncbi:tripartite tricarboxylate transporter substrate binding protein [Variovorax sp. YR216]|uniref:Bug family tripartite tricarboxylate transporter substrate binding protein n=1 Tax=Variovorax sp. YR216 TaxID=1882828 RepID=UPI00089A354F|nr:tripartite tricarboxylate transporter substrate binding protein [Variovorax sp. YR216]SEB18795.1 Tripartite-type tricarboxylate transporter, receptor component TctC [Variovorax sp. YR216]
MHMPRCGRRTALVRIAAGAAALAVSPGRLLAQGTWPERPITLITPFGGAVDILARLIAADLGGRLGQTVIVEQKIGGSGTIGMAAVARARPDGYTIGMGTTTSLTSAPHLIKSPGYDVEKSFTYLGLIQTSRQVLTVSPKLGVDTLQDFIALAKSKPGTLNFGSSGVGNSIHLAVEQFNAAVGIKAVHVPFKTGNETDTAMIAGEVQYTIASLATSLPLIQAGRIKALAVTGEGRDPALPNVPNLNESGLPVRIPDQLFGMVGPANMPAPVTSKLLKAVADMQADPAFQESVRRTGGVPSLVHGEAFRKLALSDSQTWGDLIKRLGITLSS